MKLVLSITFGPDENDAMQTTSDVADALARTARKLEQWAEVSVGDSGKIMDVNGQSVGSWEIEE